MSVGVTAIIPVWNQRELLMKLIDSIEKQSFPVTEILAVDNGSKDGAAEAAEQRGARVVRLGENKGFAQAVNIGVRACSTGHVAILNSDVELDPGWLEALMAAKAPFACGKIVSAADPSVVDGTFDLLCRGGCPWRAGHGGRQAPEDCEIDMAPFTAVLFERDAFLYLDEAFESYLEDVDYGLQCMARGIRGRYVSSAVCRHHGSASLGRWHGDSVRRMSRNQVFLVKKHYPKGLARRWWWPILVAQGLWGLLALRHGAGMDWIRGKWEGRREVPHTHNPGLEDALWKQEAAIRELQAEQGMDAYWRVYFGLVGDKRHRLPNG